MDENAIDFEYLSILFYRLFSSNKIRLYEKVCLDT